MTTILDEIVASKRREVAAARLRMPLAEMEDQAAAAPPVRDFRAAPGRAGADPADRRGQEGQPLGRGHPGRLRPDRHRPDLPGPRRGLPERADRRPLLPGAPLLPGPDPGLGRDPLAPQGLPHRRIPGRRGPAGRRRRGPPDRRDPRRRDAGAPARPGPRAGHGGPGRVPRRGQPRPRPRRRGRPGRDQQPRPPPVRHRPGADPPPPRPHPPRGAPRQRERDPDPRATSNGSRRPASRRSSSARP